MHIYIYTIYTIQTLNLTHSNMSALAMVMPSTVVPTSDGCAATMAAIIASAPAFSTPS